jgi:hypothetical protein
MISTNPIFSCHRIIFEWSKFRHVPRNSVMVDPSMERELPVLTSPLADAGVDPKA